MTTKNPRLLSHVFGVASFAALLLHPSALAQGAGSKPSFTQDRDRASLYRLFSLCQQELSLTSLACAQTHTPTVLQLAHSAQPLHGAMISDLQALMLAQGVSLAGLTSQVDSRSIDRLSNETDAVLDPDYLRESTDVQRYEVRVLDRQLSASATPDVAAFARKYLPQISESYRSYRASWSIVGSHVMQKYEAQLFGT